MTHRVGVRKGSPRRCGQIVAGVAVVALGAASVVAAGGGTAGAATAPNAQAVGRFLDGAAGGSPIQSLADLKDARATAPGSTSVQNPLDVTALGQINIPLTNAVKIPTSPAADAGVVNQVATANTNGKSLGASGAVARDGGAELSSSSGGSEPSAAKINLTDAAFGSVPIPGLGGATSSFGALGGITGEIHSVFARVATAKGGEIDTPSSGVAGLTLSIGSPALAGVITQLKTAFTTSGLGPILAAGISLTGCSLTAPDATDISLADGAVVISPTGAKITVDVQKLIASVLGKDISDLSTSNFDLVSFLVKNLPSILADGVGGLLTSTTKALAAEFKKCTGQSASALNALADQLLAGQDTLFNAIKGITAPLATAGASGLTQLADGLKNVLDIGLNVQSGPGIQPREKTYAFTSKLDATPNQATPVVENQTVVRAVEINVLSAAAIPGGGSGGVTAALANAAAGPSDVSPDAVASTTQAPSAVVSTNIPTGIPAGQAGGTPDGGVPVLPLVAVLMLLAVGGGTFWHLRVQHASRSH